MEILHEILTAFGLDKESIAIEQLTTGLINNTWKVSDNKSTYIFQRVNNAVFTDPNKIASNIEKIAMYLSKQHPAYFFVAPIKTKNGDSLIYRKGNDGGYFRLFPFVEGSHSKDVLQTADQAFEAATQFGRFTKLLGAFDVSTLQTTLPHFHDLSFRYQQFKEALTNGNRERIEQSAALINVIKQHADIVAQFESIQNDASFTLRVTHHDTKISNVLFNDNEKGICVIDLDTVMPGYFISDVGDMMRTYLSPVSEEEKDFDKIIIRDEFYKAIVKGYYGEMKEDLSEKEKTFFFYSGKFMIYMQALRFLTDHINNDIYYGAKYSGHNFVRAGNQLVLLNKLIEKEATLIN